MQKVKFKLKEIKFFNTKDLPTLTNIPENILNITYQYSCENLKTISDDIMKKMLL